MSYEFLIKTAKKFHKKGQESTQNAMEKWLPLLIEIKQDNAAYQKILSRVIKALNESGGQEAFETVMSVALGGYLSNHHGTNMLSADKAREVALVLVSHLNDDNRLMIVQWLKPEQMKQFLNDPDERIRNVVYRNLKVDDAEDKIYSFNKPGVTDIDNKDKLKTLYRKLVDMESLVTPMKIPKLLPYIDMLSFTTPVYEANFKDYIQDINNEEAEQILVKYPNLTTAWKNMLKRKIGIEVKVPTYHEVMESYEKITNPKKMPN